VCRVLELRFLFVLCLATFLTLKGHLELTCCELIGASFRYISETFGLTVYKQLCEGGGMLGGILGMLFSYSLATSC
jgi:hypothetical protein